MPYRTARFFRFLLLAVFCGQIPSLFAGNLNVELVDESGQPLENAVISLSGPLDKHSSPPPGVMDQVAQQFMPNVLAVRTGAAVSFPNSDNIRHHVYSFSPAKRFELKLYIGTPASPVVFDQAGVVVLGCNIHDEMIGWIAVVDTPHFGSTGANGQVQLRDVPEGSYRLRVWHSGLAVGAPALDVAQRLGAAGAAASVVLKGLTP